MNDNQRPRSTHNTTNNQASQLSPNQANALQTALAQLQSVKDEFNSMRIRFDRHEARLTALEAMVGIPKASQPNTQEVQNISPTIMDESDTHTEKPNGKGKNVESIVKDNMAKATAATPKRNFTKNSHSAPSNNLSKASESNQITPQTGNNVLKPKSNTATQTGPVSRNEFDRLAGSIESIEATLRAALQAPTNQQ